ncbi:hypothetical protein NUW58_g1195 [Xylaria curta]|uniref:Uncharacterized protein n=1 Tax=Xylaria curta TaxID=42375 RepID=A0ACC1PL91_9PEZI|nr:hypothetical protein NUW58_g1195 [Xylaria curta]
MPVDGSYLSSPKYGYDFVVATTQASINSGLAAFLAEGDQPTLYLCFLVDPLTGNPTDEVTLEELLDKTNGINPFDIPAGTPYTDPRIAPLTTALFCVGIKIQIGLPPGIAPKNLPPIVSLGSNASNVVFNLFCSEFTVIQNQPPSGWGSTGTWNVWSQPSGQPWYITTHVNLVMADLDKELDTPYFNSHPDEKAALKRQLENLSATAFSLQQLLFDLDNAALQDVPTFGGIPPNSNADIVLQKSFTSIYSKAAKERGWPLLSVTATVQSPDPSQLQLTSFERQVSQLKDYNGVVIPNPTTEQQNASTLDHLCAANDNPLPGTSSFSWNWVQPTEVDQLSGVISVNRNALAEFFLPEILPTARKGCCLCVPTATAYPLQVMGDVSIDVQSGQSPDKVEVTTSGENVIRIEYSDSKKDEDWSGASYCGVTVSPSYVCDVKFKNTAIQVVQRIKIHLWIGFDNTAEEIDVYDMTRTDDYSISVSQTGGLRIVQTNTSVQDDSDDPAAGGFIDFFTGIDSVVQDIKDKLHDIEPTQLNPIPFDRLQAFVFPGSKTFTYKTVDFSDHQDLVCEITYVDPSQSRRRLRDVKDVDADPQKESSPGLTLTSSSELMQNYAHGQVVSPTEKFEALQTANGLALLFAIDTSGVFHVIKEQSGKANAGWVINDLSSSIISKQFPGNSNVKADTFSVGQSALDGTISLALAVEAEDTDWLFISLANNGSDTSWTSEPAWTRVNFDAVGENPAGIFITGVMFAETMGGRQYLVVDINRLGSSSKNIARYHIDPSKSTGRYWNKADVPIDIEDGNYQSCVGQVKNGYVDGVYTSGQTSGAPQLVYSPIENAFGSGPPLPRRLGLPGGVLPSAIATARYADPASPFYTFTDLFSISGKTLYRFAPDGQQDGATAKPLVTSDTFSDTDQLYAMTHGGVTTLWGTNSSNEVYYVSCQTSQLDQPGSWSAVVPILKDIERISSYINKTNAKAWRSQEITIAAPPDVKPLSFNSYTTTIVVKDKNDLPAGEVELEILTDSSTPLYINGLYYIVGPTPVTVTTDAMGTVTIVEASNDLNASVLTVAIPNDIISFIIDPMNYAFNKIASLNSEGALRDASYPTKTAAGGVIGDAGYGPLVDSSTSRHDLQVVASRMSNLKDVWGNVKPPSTTPLRRLKPTRPEVVPATLYRASPNYRDIWDDIAIAAGDLFQWLKSGVEAVIDIIKDAATDAWHFIAEIAGKVYRAVLDTVEAIVGALEWIFNVIKTAIEQLIAFVKFLFEWDDIRRTKDVLHNVTKLYLKDQVDGLGGIKTLFDNEIVEVEKTLSEWAGLGDWAPLSKPPSSSAVSPAKDQTASSMSFANHFKNNFGSLVVKETKATTNVVQETIDGLLDALSKEGEVLSEVYTKLQEVATNMPSMSVADALKKIAVIFGEGLLSSVRVVVDALLDALASLANTMIDLLDTQIYIPIISDILEAIGVPNISYFDLFSWIAAVSFTVVYKITNGEAPFPDNSNVNAIKSASSWADLAALFGRTTDYKAPSEIKSGIIPHELEKVVHIAGHAAAGFTTFTCCFLVGFEAEASSGENPFSLPAAILGGVGSALVGTADFLAPYSPVENTAVAAVAKATTAASIISKIIFCGPVQSKLAVAGSGFSALAVGDGRATSAIVDSILVIPSLFVTGWHFYELSQKPASTEQAAAILGEIANVTSYATRISYAVAVNMKDPVTKQIAIIATLACNVASGGLHTAEAFLVE